VTVKQRFAMSVAAWAMLATATAEEMPVPAGLQVALLKKIFEYDRTLSSTDGVVLALVHQEPESPLTRELLKEFQAGGIRAQAIPEGELGASVASAHVLYVMPGVDTGPVQAWCERNKVLSVSGLPELVSAGKVAVGIGLKDQKPEILVHIRRVKSEGHDLAAALLNLATVIR
jgi:hypothetical protein